MGDVDEGTRVRWLLYRVCIVVGRDSMHLRRGRLKLHRVDKKMSGLC